MSGPGDGPAIAHDALAALIALHLDLPRQGPGDPAALDRMLDRLGVADGAAAADLGCGTGAAALRLAETRGMRVLALDAAEAFVARLRARLDARPPRRGAVVAEVGDMLAPPVAEASLDLIVSEGAAYAAGFARAASAWRRLVRPGGALIVSECVWFGAHRPPEAAAHWRGAYPEMGTGGEAIAAAEAAGWRLAAAERLGPEAWEAYYAPLLDRCAALAPDADAEMARAIAEARAEAALHARTGGDWGYLLMAFDAG